MTLVSLEGINNLEAVAIQINNEGLIDSNNENRGNDESEKHFEYKVNRTWRLFLYGE